MRLFRYWMVVPLDTAFKATFEVVPVSEIKEENAVCFEEVIRAIKKTGCDWSMHEISDKVLSYSEHAEVTYPKNGTP